MGLTLLEVLGCSVNELEGDELETTLLETADDVSDKTAVDAVGLLHGTKDTILFNQTHPTRGVDDGGGGDGETERTLTMMYVRSLLLGDMIDETFCCSGWYT